MPAVVTPNYDAVTDGYAECWHGSGVLNHGDYPKGNFRVLGGTGITDWQTKTVAILNF